MNFCPCHEKRWLCGQHRSRASCDSAVWSEPSLYSPRITVKFAICKTSTYGTTRKWLLIANVLKFRTLYSIVLPTFCFLCSCFLKYFYWNGKQCRPSSYCSWRSSLIWVCTVRICHFVRHFGQAYLEIWCEICHACSKPATWKGAHWCGCCSCTCMLIKNLMMMMTLVYKILRHLL